jgi:hypothetical protein
MPDPLVITLPERDEVRFAARMTNIQFNALAKRLDRATVVSDLERLAMRRRPVKGKAYSPSEVRRWLLNGWNTELLLRTNRQILTGEALRHSLHWSFPQAYYSAFAVALAFFRTVGYSEQSHVAVIRKFGSDAAAKRYPEALCALAEGRPAVPIGVRAVKLPHSTYFDPDVPDTVDGQLAQFLCATRRIDLDEKKADVKIQNKSGSRRKAYRPEDWAKVSAALGYTSIFSLLYRKRIKANYRDIDTFLHEELNAQSLSLHLLNIVSTLNLVHEVFIAQAVGLDMLREALLALPGGKKQGPHVRLAIVASLAE